MGALAWSAGGAGGIGELSLVVAIDGFGAVADLHWDRPPLLPFFITAVDLVCFFMMTEEGFGLWAFLRCARTGLDAGGSVLEEGRGVVVIVDDIVEGVVEVVASVLVSGIPDHELWSGS